MTVWKDIKSGLSSFFQAIGFIKRQKLWYFFIYPLIFSLILYGLYAWLKDVFSEPSNQPIPTDLSSRYWISFVDLVKSVILVLLLELNKSLVLIFLSPVLASLSQKVEYMLTGNRYKYSFRQLMKDIRRAINISLQNMITLMVIYMIWSVLAFFITPLKGITPVFYVVAGFYFYGFAFIDYVNERRRLNVKESTIFVREHFWFAFVLGGLFSVLFFVYFVGAIIAPIIAIVAATIGMHGIVDLSNNKHAINSVLGKEVENEISELEG